MRRILYLLLISILIANVAFAATFADPTRVGIGARPLALGRAYVGLAEGAETIFINPAGVGKADQVSLVSMYSSVLGDTNYVVLGGLYPAYFGTIGAGLISTNTGDIPIYNVRGDYDGSGAWGSSVILLTYGVNLETLLKLPLSVGVSAKYFNAGGSGSDAIQLGSGSGVDMDLGALYTPTSFLSIGAVAQNSLPASLGGKIVKQSGQEESNPMIPKLGVRVGLVGEQGLIKSDKQNIVFVSDYELSQPTATLHSGLEFIPNSNLVLRAGMDGNDLTAGVGLRVSGLEFNYAYHPYQNVADNGTHFFSISFVGKQEKALKKIEPVINTLTLINPKDKSILYENSIKVEGSVAGNITKVKINDVAAELALPSAGKVNFAAELPLKKIGKNKIVVHALDAQGNVVATETRKILRLTLYSDVPNDYWAKESIEYSATAGLVKGSADGKFLPDKKMTREQFAALLGKASNKKIKLNKPKNNITREEAITLLAKVNALKPPYVVAAKKAGYLEYLGAKNFNGKESISRAEAIELLSHTFKAEKLLNDLASWDKGF